MTKRILWLLILLALPIASAITECQRVQDRADIPCEILSSWRPSNCGEYNLSIYLSNGTLINQTLWQNRTTFCAVNFNYTLVGTYYYNSSVDVGTITVEDNVALEVILGIGIVTALLLFFAYKLEEEHYFLKLLLILSSMTLLTLIPLSTFTLDVGKTFYTSYLWILRFFWTYVFVYLTWWIYKKYFMDKRMLEP